MSNFSSRSRILLFHMCFGIRILSLFHLATQIVFIQNLNCPKITKNACAQTWFLEWSSIHLKCSSIWKKSVGSLLVFSILLSVIKNIHLYHLPTSFWINHQNTDCASYWPAISKDDTASLCKTEIKIMSAHAFLAF